VFSGGPLIIAIIIVSPIRKTIFTPPRFRIFLVARGWIVSDKYNDTRFDYIGDFAKFPELRWLDKYHVIPSATLAIVLFSSADCRSFSGALPQHHAPLARHVHHQIRSRIFSVRAVTIPPTPAATLASSRS